MKYLPLIALVFAACGNSSKLDPKDNLACKAIKAYEEKADCTPVLTDVGDHHTSTAIWVYDKKPLYCILNDATIGAICGGAVNSSQSSAPQAAEATKPVEAPKPTDQPKK